MKAKTQIFAAHLDFAGTETRLDCFSLIRFAVTNGGLLEGKAPECASLPFLPPPR
jgi:hypothetical protein